MSALPVGSARRETSEATHGDDAAAAPRVIWTDRWWPALRRRLPLLCFTLVLFTAWEIYVDATGSRTIPSPSAVFTAFVDLASSGRLVDAAIPSLQLLAVGLALSWTAGLVLGVALARLRRVELTLTPYLSGLYVTPDIALVPIIVVWFGYGFSGKLVVIFLSTLFPVMYNVIAGVKAAPTDLQEMARSFRASRLTILVRVVIPSALPYVFAGFRQSIGRGVVGMVIAEAYLQLGGLGSLVFFYGGRFAPDYLIASIAILPMIGLTLVGILGVVERRATSRYR